MVTPLNCYLDGRFLGPDGDPDVIDGEVGYPRCGRCVREHRGTHMIGTGCVSVHPQDLSEQQIAMIRRWQTAEPAPGSEAAARDGAGAEGS